MWISGCAHRWDFLCMLLLPQASSFWLRKTVFLIRSLVCHNWNTIFTCGFYQTFTQSIVKPSTCWIAYGFSCTGCRYSRGLFRFFDETFKAIPLSDILQVFFLFYLRVAFCASAASPTDRSNIHAQNKSPRQNTTSKDFQAIHRERLHRSCRWRILLSSLGNSHCQSLTGLDTLFIVSILFGKKIDK